MFRIRKIINPNLDGNRQVIQRIKEIITIQFPAHTVKQIEHVSEQMINPVETGYHTSVVIAEDFRGNISGFAILIYMSDLRFCYLYFLAVTPGKPTSGVGDSLYERVQEEAASVSTIGLFFECLPDDPSLQRVIHQIKSQD